MMLPGINSGTGNKSADTRMKNTKTNAKQMGMVGNPAAQASLRKKTSQVKVAPVGKLQVPERQEAPPVALPTAGPALEPQPEFNPEVFKEDMTNNIAAQIRTQQFVQSPRIQDATTSIQLKEFFNKSNPDKRNDTRTLLDQIISRTGLGNG